MNKIEVLTQAKTAREQEVFEYQINIDNYVIAIDLIKDNVEMAAFKANLEDLLSANKREQAKAQLMLDVINIQLQQSS